MIEGVCRTCGALANADQIGEPCPVCSKKAGPWAGLIVEFTPDNLPRWKPHIETDSGPDHTHQDELEKAYKEVERLRWINVAAYEASGEPWRDDLSLEGHYDAGRKYVHEAMWKAHREWQEKNNETT